MYNKKIIEYFRKPRNVGEIKDADGVGKIKSPVCGDLMHVYIKVGNDSVGGEIIKDCKVVTFGCIAAVATASSMTEMAIGKPIEEAHKITSRIIADDLGGLPEEKFHCTNLAVQGLKRAIDDYRKKK